jgi:anaerobic magnesium-protoporphyrin IX monomethyl ester cyclase
MNNEMNVGRGAGYVAASLTRAGYDLRFFDTMFIKPAHIVQAVALGGYDLLMFSSMSQMFPLALDIMRQVSDRVRLPTVLGGIHATIMGKTLLERHSEIGCLIVGEGEDAAVSLLHALEGRGDLGKVPGLAWRKDGVIRQNPLGPAQDLAKSPLFPWYYFPHQAIVQADSGFAYVNATRGCPYNCTYCCNGIYLKHYGKNYLRFRPLDGVIEELAFVHAAYGPKLMYFGDEMILSDMDYAAGLFEAIKSQLDMPYGCMARVEHINPEMIKLMSETGCRYLAMGVECGDEDFRKRHLRRFMSNEQIISAFNMARKAGIFTTSFNMIGFPLGDDAYLTEATVELNQKIQPDYVQMTIFYPFPGTRMYDYCLEHDLIDEKKQARLQGYHRESVLKGVVLEKRLNMLRRMLNPEGFNFKL